MFPLFDCCNYLLFNLPSIILQKLQIRRFNRFHYTLQKITSVLPIIYSITYKLSLIIHKIIHYNTPAYIASVIKPSVQSTSISYSIIYLFYQPLIFTILFQTVDDLSHYMLLTTGIHCINIYVPSFQNSHLKNTLNIIYIHGNKPSNTIGLITDF